MKKPIIGLALLLAVFIAGCGPSQVNTPKNNLPITGSLVATTGGATELVADPSDSNATVNWACANGELDKTTGKTIVWKAPSAEGTYQIKATATSGSSSTTTTANVLVVNSPLKVLSWNLTPDLIGGKDVYITFNNTSDKIINAYKIHIYMWNNFADRVSYLTNSCFNGIASDENISPGSNDTASWSLYWATGVTKIIPWVYEVAYTDGSTWKLVK